MLIQPKANCSYFFRSIPSSLTPLFEGDPYAWEIFSRLSVFFAQVRLGIHLGTISPSAYLIAPEKIFIDSGAVIEPGAYIQGPCFIGAGSVVRHGAYIRGDVVIGHRCVVGHGTELKNAILLDEAHAAHFSYLGDSILGNRVNLGAGVKCANVRLDRKTIMVRVEEQRWNTDRRKLGAMIGDGAQIGCNAVINPGTLIGPNTHCAPLLNIGGWIPESSVLR